jgi:hypothetical protein
MQVKNSSKGQRIERSTANDIGSTRSRRCGDPAHRESVSSRLDGPVLFNVPSRTEVQYGSSRRGGTALLLLFPPARRLSIDIDIVGDFALDELKTLSASSVFIRLVEDDRKPNDIPKRHFKHYYASAIDGRETYVLLDVLYIPRRGDIFHLTGPRNPGTDSQAC